MKTKFTLTKYKEVFPFLGNQWDWFEVNPESWTQLKGSR